MKISAVRETKSRVKTAPARVSKKRTAVPARSHQLLASQIASLFGWASELTRSWGPFRAFVAIIVAVGIYSISSARTDTIAISIALIVIMAIGLAFLARLWRVS